MLEFPAVAVDALLFGMSQCGLPTSLFRKQFGLADSYSDPEERLPKKLWHDLWREAKTRDERTELATLVARSIPFGMFGIIDYLAGSSATFGGGLRALADHFSAVAGGIKLELVTENSDHYTFRILNTGDVNFADDEFTLAIILHRFTEVTAGKFYPLRVYLTGPVPKTTPHEALFGGPVTYGSSHAGFDLIPSSLYLPQTTSDSGLHNTMLSLLKKLNLSDGKTTELEIAIRARLRNLLRQGRATASDVAPSLGLSERTLHRRLADVGTSFQKILDRFRLDEGERLLHHPEIPLSQIGLMLGYSDQASWSRAFKRLRGISPKNLKRGKS